MGGLLKADRNRWFSRCFRRAFKVWNERSVEGRKFQTAGAASWNELEPKWSVKDITSWWRKMIERARRNLGMKGFRQMWWSGGV